MPVEKDKVAMTVPIDTDIVPVEIDGNASSRLPNLKIRSTDASAPRRPLSWLRACRASANAHHGSCWALRPYRQPASAAA